MYERKLPIELDCGLHLFMEVMNGKWKINLIWCIHSGIKRPGELQRHIPKASRRLLDTQLKQLTDQGILIKTIFDQRPAKVMYELTPLGETLIPVIEIAARWGESHRAVLEPLFQSPDFPKA
ncbi:helix-turn-helix transcriptional regulator [Spirosoma sp. KCTC 42546]|uniref:winged helix-turn-helix transcriptional regulator n=1 Tax=Spirosoma sp. KCTC 42546 TaxID=2520506 RepID=UPI0011580E3F|nr:helix-turn-helix domain-containing protein [Spirosoma sp. KCTC 42546]QDK80105.1 helix-turn-helix transcriptional regulator [Spirosoma sp. KCTC 42546]